MSRVVEKTFTGLTSGGIGHPDFGQPLPVGQAPVGNIYTLTDMGELAARLGSIDTVDRRGNVMWMDDFEDSIAKWYQFATGTGGSIALSTEAARNGAKSAKLVTPSDTNQWALIARYFGGFYNSRISYEVSFADLEDHTWLDVALIQACTGSDSYEGGLRYDPDLKLLRIRVGLATWETIATVSLFDSLAASKYCWNTAKLVIDLTTMKYVRAILNGVQYDISPYSLYTVGSAVPPTLTFTTLIGWDVAANKHVYIDDAIMKQNEPAND